MARNNKQGCKQPSSNGSTEVTQPSSETSDDLFIFQLVTTLLPSMKHERCFDWHQFLQIFISGQYRIFFKLYQKATLPREGAMFSPESLSLRGSQVLIWTFIHEKFYFWTKPWNSWQVAGGMRQTEWRVELGCAGRGMTLNQVYWLQFRSFYSISPPMTSLSVTTQCWAHTILFILLSTISMAPPPLITSTSLSLTTWSCMGSGGPLAGSGWD